MSRITDSTIGTETRPTVDAAMPALWDRGVLTARPVATVHRWHMILDSGAVIALDIADDADPDDVVRRFEEAVAGRLTAMRSNEDAAC